ncbi:MAG: hypothetical protein DRN81_03345, partial [Thermoproteota archaeon]
LAKKGGRRTDDFAFLYYLSFLEKELARTQSKMADFVRSRLLYPATLPDEPIWPKPGLCCLLGVGLGLLFGVSGALIAEYLSRSH